MVKIQEHKNRFFITIPKEIIDYKNWKKGQDLLLIVNEKNAVVIKNVHDGQKFNKEEN